MRKSGSRIKCDVDRIHSDSFVEFCRNGNPNVFVRNRKMPLDDLTFSMINRKGLTLKLELRGYMNISHPGTQISKPGYLKQRMKLNPAAFVDLYQFHNRNLMVQISMFQRHRKHLPSMETHPKEEGNPVHKSGLAVCMML